MSNISTVAEQADHIVYGLVYNETIFDHFNITNQSLLLIRKESEETEVILCINICHFKPYL